MGATAELGSASRSSAISPARSSCDGQAEVLLQAGAARRAGHRLDDAALLQPLEKDLGARQLALGQQLLDLGQPLLAEAEDQPALRPCRRVAEDRNECVQEVAHLAGQGRVGAGVDLLRLVEDHGERLAGLRFDGTPAGEQIGA